MALWIRNLPYFGLKFEWHGDDHVLVTDKEGVIDIAFTRSGSKDPVAIGKLMRHLEDRMHRDAIAMG